MEPKSKGALNWIICYKWYDVQMAHWLKIYQHHMIGIFSSLDTVLYLVLTLTWVFALLQLRLSALQCGILPQENSQLTMKHTLYFLFAVTWMECNNYNAKGTNHHLCMEVEQTCENQVGISSVLCRVGRTSSQLHTQSKVCTTKGNAAFAYWQLLLFRWCSGDWEWTHNTCCIYACCKGSIFNGVFLCRNHIFGCMCVMWWCLAWSGEWPPLSLQLQECGDLETSCVLAKDRLAQPLFDHGISRYQIGSAMFLTRALPC